MYVYMYECVYAQTPSGILTLKLTQTLFMPKCFFLFLQPTILGRK